MTNPAPESRSRARAVVVAFAVTFAWALLFVFAVHGDVQTANTAELVRRHSDAVAFFTVDYVFVVLYGVVGPLAIWRFGATLPPPRGGGRVPAWLAVGVLALVAGALLDAAENALLLSASSNGSASNVRLAHVIAVPKYAFGGIGLILGIRALVAAIGRLRVRA